MTLTATPPFTIDSILADAGELAALPQVVLRVIELTGDTGASAIDLERAIATDPTLAARILTLANSAYYGLPRQLSSLREAVVFLGFRSVRTLALAVTVFAGFLGKSDTDALARRAVWRHSLNAALCARTLTTLLPQAVQESFTADEAFTGGLLHDIGKMALDRSRHALYLELLAQAETQGLRYYEVEAQMLPFGHALIGAALARRWNLPASLCETIAFHHTPRAAQASPRLTAAVGLANEIAHALEDGHDDPECGLLRERTSEVLAPLRLSGDNLPSLLAACRRERETGWEQLFMG